jgi:hypothetical protein
MVKSETDKVMTNEDGYFAKMVRASGPEAAD